MDRSKKVDHCKTHSRRGESTPSHKLRHKKSSRSPYRLAQHAEHIRNRHLADETITIPQYRPLLRHRLARTGLIELSKNSPFTIHPRTIMRLPLLIVLLSLPAAFAEPAPEDFASNWHQWRGPNSTGHSPTATPPISWSETDNVLWKVPIEGHGTASPIVWNDRVFILTAINTGVVDPALPKPEDQPKRVFGITHPNTAYQFVVLCLDRQTGQTIWRDVAAEMIPHEGHHNDASFASASPITDGERLYCWFGSAGLFCYDLAGNRLWQRDLGKAYVGASLGEGTSPAVYGDRIVIVRDHARQSTIEVLDTGTGDTVWKKDRDEPNAWATPRVVDHNGHVQVITAASNFVRSYDLSSGEIIWQCSGLTGNVTPVPAVYKDTVICMSGYKGFKVISFPLNATGEVSSTDTRWSHSRGTPYVPSSVLAGDHLYFTQSNQAILTCLNAETGSTIIDRTRLDGLQNIYSSPVAANGHIYITGRNGRTLVLKQGDNFNVVANNNIGERVDASPAVAGDQLFVRSLKSLFCIAE